MFCRNCGTKINDNEKFCPNCGQQYQNINAGVNQTNNANNQNHKSNVGLIIGGIIGGVFLVAIIGFVCILSLFKSVVKEYNRNINDYTGTNGITDIDTSDDDITPSSSGTSNVKGTYTREVFSNHSFDYVTSTLSAVFTFKSDSTFEIKYDTGETYRGTYEVYNGLNIMSKTSAIKQDTTISYSEQLAKDINSVAEKMMYDSDGGIANNMLNTYLLWIETDTGIIHPFMVLYYPDKNSGDCVNIIGQEQGTLTLK